MIGQAVKHEIDGIEAEVNEAIRICHGDLRSTLRATLVTNAFLERRPEKVLEMVSAGYVSGRVRAVPNPRRSKSNSLCSAPAALP